MTDDEPRQPAPPAPPPPGLPLPGLSGRTALSGRGRTILAIWLGVAFLVALVVGGLLAVRSDDQQPRSVTLPLEDRDASPALIREAQAVNFRPQTAAGVGEVEDARAAAAKPPGGSDLLPVGTKAPPFTLETPTGDEVSLKQLRGKAVLLEFFAAWCPHCAAEAPHLRKLAETLPEGRYGFVSVNGSNERAATVLAYHVYFGLPFPALLDPAPDEEPVEFPDHGKRGPVSRAYGVGFFPTFYVIDPQGRITWRSDGEQPDALLRRELERAARS